MPRATFSSTKAWIKLQYQSSERNAAARRSKYSRLNKRSVLYKAKRMIEYCKAQTRAKVEHTFRVIMRQFGYVKVRFRGLLKNTAQLTTLFALSNLWMARKQLMGMGELRV
ncbi:IS5/IS1182 family transposase [Pseudomonas syringae]|uniref:IS5/IS1182 family transposase n=1 Tax=Pseudomonas syringae TaxID=317 RepID=UPI0005C916FB|nr:IS5/IS1182 family transposase [Pseudomonas syringae]KPY32357.1 Mobile element protein [Pseudomonas syringae pv. papulans]KWS40621.1 hypothetical protein AL059_22535 [Pseudomonas syringae pv. papulans]RMN40771.1 Transposase [Pseudomonas syringae pv. papulans]RMN59761.1 Mobile element protein [Pseudomonas syringae pv. papulans]RMV43403.1 Transposase [Pseudomonas syringae pv. papulans]